MPLEERFFPRESAGLPAGRRRSAPRSPPPSFLPTQRMQVRKVVGMPKTPTTRHRRGRSLVVNGEEREGRRRARVREIGQASALRYRRANCRCQTNTQNVQTTGREEGGREVVRRPHYFEFNVERVKTVTSKQELAAPPRRLHLISRVLIHSQCDIGDIPQCSAMDSRTVARS